MNKRSFIHPDVLLESEPAVELYHRYAADLPIFDSHVRIAPADLAADRRFENPADLWLQGDPDKARALRAQGVAERAITGEASARDKFQAWAETVPALVGQPLYVWTHLDLARPFGLSDRLLCGATAQDIWDALQTRLARPEFSIRGLLRERRVRTIATTDDPADSLKHHRRLSGLPDLRVHPAFCPDRALGVDQPADFNACLDRLGAAANLPIRSPDDLLAALLRRTDAFHEIGGRLARHTLEQLPPAAPDPARAAAAFARARAGHRPAPETVAPYRAWLLHELGRLYHAHDWTLHLRLGAAPSPGSRRRKTAGGEGGGEIIGDAEQARPLAHFLDRLDREGHLPRVLLEPQNPRDLGLFASLTGGFQDESCPGQVQLVGAEWTLGDWAGPDRLLDAVSGQGLLSRFTGLATGARTALALSRHEYFRRRLCNRLGQDIQRGRLPDDLPWIGRLVQDICHRNAENYFRLAPPTPAAPAV